MDGSMKPSDGEAAEAFGLPSEGTQARVDVSVRQSGHGSGRSPRRSRLRRERGGRRALRERRLRRRLDREAAEPPTASHPPIAAQISPNA